MRYCCKALRLKTLLCAVSPFIYGLSLLLPIDLCIAIYCLKINALIAFAFLLLTLANFIAQNKTLRYHPS